MHPTRANATSDCRSQDLAGKKWRLQDQLGDAVYDRDGNDLQGHGLYLDMSAWQQLVLSMKTGS